MSHNTPLDFKIIDRNQHSGHTVLVKLEPGSPFSDYRHALKHLAEPHMIPDFLRKHLSFMADAGAFFTTDNPTGSFTVRAIECGTMTNVERVFYHDFTMGPAWSARLACNLRLCDLPSLIALLAELGIYLDTGMRVTQDHQPHKSGMTRITMGVYFPYRDWNEMVMRCMLIRSHARPKPPGTSILDIW